MSRPTIVLTGGGTAGHVSVNEALLPELRRRGYDIHYIGSYEGIEKDIMSQYEFVTYHAISSGKLRRYMSAKNFTDPFRVLNGVRQASRLLKKINPSVVFSKGGFVSVPVALAAKRRNIPVIAHESDVTPGLANKIALPFAKTIFTVFEETLQHVPAEKSAHIGPIIRQELFEGERDRGLALTKFAGDKPVIIVMGGSQGARILNEKIRLALPELLPTYDIIHLCGKGNIDRTLDEQKGYRQYEYVMQELPDLLAASDYAISRAGSNAIFELLALSIPMLLVPLSAEQSRGDQLLNANLFKQLEIAKVIQEEQFEQCDVVREIGLFAEEAPKMKDKMETMSSVKTASQVVDLILSNAK
ncbi:undecaprenyldiphospho-muramoylpentapeptide beta-N-acetylglucosaminyltransferase [Savagea sp. SN6]|uniref:UDP-N-acetylglucosamine--N-acetylmuramyl-(pentapeptide) pyrophosphoryl-undecaprenol N-acetylglucosamine transferase n=1 Tax=Savagea serpentis TaxID=2785297 RepID=A0A8J7G8Z1_9BACL|nr:undecaprenyldiphospho-muramoylpentapeptide beta-N-acetylglucosaminyltransferase [Savagea serpentis]MBF4500354.1 undecaprenyldiphospho-muramoylpentapeptide beta-N-acetylglucosaminyltransferase [Savagea serpentis]